MDKIVSFRELELNDKTMPKVEVPLGIVIYLLSSVTLKR